MERVDYGDDPFEFHKKWCKFFEFENEKNDDFSEESESFFEFEACPVYRRLRKKEIENDTSEVSKKDLWHFSEYFHGDERKKPMCVSRNCRQFSRLEDGGYG